MRDPTLDPPTRGIAAASGVRTRLPPRSRGGLLPSGLAPGGALACVLLLAGCGDLPRPFEGQPGATAMRLSHPPPPRLDVVLPGDSLLSDQGSSVWAVMTRNALVSREIPAVLGPPRRADWRLALSAHMSGGQVVPTYTVLSPKGEPRGSTEGAPVPVSAWAAGSPDTLRREVDASTGRITDLLGAIDAAIAQSDPNSLVNRPARVFFQGVTGAPGDGDRSLAQQMRRQLPEHGDVVQDAATGADFALRGTVRLQPDPHGTERVEITWIVLDAQGREIGRVAQLNDVPKGSLDVYWGDVALVVAQQAGGGVHDVIVNASGRRKDAAPPAKPARPKPAV